MTTPGLATVLAQLRRLFEGRAAGDASDDELLDRFVSRRDEAAFASILRRHGPLVLGVCRRLLSNPQDVEDAFQAVFLILVRKAASLRRRERLAAWLYGVAHRVALRARGQAVRRASRPLPPEPPAAAEPTPELFWQEVREVLDEEVGRLPEKYRLPVILCYLQGMTNEDAARALGCPKGTVATRLARARDRLRIRLARRGVTHAPGLLGTALVHCARPPTVPEILFQAAADAAARVAAGGAAAAVSASTAALVEGVLRDMFRTKLKLIAASALAVGFVFGAGALAYHSRATEPPPPVKAPDKGPGDKAAKDDDKPAVWQARGNFKAGDGSLAAVALSPDGKTAAVALGGSIDAPPGLEPMAAATAVQLWDLEKVKKRATLTDARRPLPDMVGSLTFAPDGKTLAVGDSTLVLWDVAKGKPKRDIPDQGSSLNAVAFSPDGKAVATVRADGVLRVSDAETAKERFAVQAHKTLAAPSAAFVDDGKTIATADFDGTVKLWDAAKGKLRETYSLKGKAGAPTVLVFAPDGKAAATATDGGAVDVWDLTTGKLRTTLKVRGKGALATQLAFSPDGATLAVGGLDGTVTLWDLATEKELTTLKGHKGSIHRLAFSADGKTLASGDEKGKVFVWSPAPEAPK